MEQAVRPAGPAAVRAGARRRRRGAAYALVPVIGLVAVLLHSTAGRPGAADGALAGWPSAGAAATSPPPDRAVAPAPPAVNQAAHHLVLALGATPATVRVRWVHGPLELASPLEDSALAIGFTAPQQAWVVEVDSSTPRTCTDCMGVVPQVGRVHGVVVVDCAASLAMASYVRNDPADLGPFGDTHELVAPY